MHKKRNWIGVTSFVAAAAVLASWSASLAQQETPPASKPATTRVIVKGESDRGVSAALKEAVDRIPAPKGDAVKYFQVVSITDQKTARDSKCIVEVEVDDRPIPRTERAKD